jgi:uncharacterized metal-binding protein YceD (DUF177 family)
MSSNERDPIRAAAKDPWRTAPVIVAQIPETGLHREIEANHAALEALAVTAEVPAVMSAQAAFDLSVKRDGKVHVVGRVRARIGQICVVTLEPIETDIDEPIDLMFAPPEQIPDMADLVEDDADESAEIPDPPEPIEGGQIDLGRLATDALFLAIDPYPRKPGAVFEPEVAADAPEDHPFAALRVLKSDLGPADAETKGKTQASAQQKTKGS